MTFRTPDEAVALANNTEYGLAASVWSESINLALDIAPKLKAGVVWINSTNLFDASAGFGGYKESGFGREGGREGRARLHQAGVDEGGEADRREAGRQARARGSSWSAAASTARQSSISAASRRGRTAAIRGRSLDASTASSSARSARATARTSATPSRRRGRPPAGRRRASTTGRRSSTTSPRISTPAPANSPTACAARRRRQERQTRLEVDASVDRLFAFAAWADKYEGAVHRPPFRGPGAGDERAGRRDRHRLPGGAGLLAFVTLMGAAHRDRQHGGHDPVGEPGAGRHRLLPGARHLRRAGGRRQHRHRRQAARSASNSPSTTRSMRSGISAMPAARRRSRRPRSATSSRPGRRRSTRDWNDARVSGGREILQHATQVKNIWIPYGE